MRNGKNEPIELPVKSDVVPGDVAVLCATNVVSNVTCDMTALDIMIREFRRCFKVISTLATATQLGGGR